MEKNLNAVLLLTVTTLLSLGAGCADSGGLAVAGKAGTLGLGGELTAGVSSDINARVGFNTMDFDFSGDLANVEYDFGLDFDSYSFLLDWFVFDGPLRLTGGLISMDHKLNLDADGASGEFQQIGDSIYDWGDIGVLSGVAEVDGVAPYIGIGWGDILDRSKRWGFYSDFGVAFTESPKVSLAATGMPPGLEDDLQRESDDIEDDLKNFKFYPVLSVGLFIRF
ncbi:MAG: hypothetical protein ACYSWO_09730 [Planctomycetota bacterium]|jgi:hypothetical protein